MIQPLRTRLAAVEEEARLQMQKCKDMGIPFDNWDVAEVPLDPNTQNPQYLWAADGLNHEYHAFLRAAKEDNDSGFYESARTNERFANAISILEEIFCKLAKIKREIHAAEKEEIESLKAEATQ